MLGGLDGLVNNVVVIDLGGKGMDDIDLDKWDQVMNVNVCGVWLMMCVCCVVLCDSGWGVIVNLVFDIVMWGVLNLMVYVVSKGVVMVMMCFMVCELGVDGIIINVVVLGLVLVEVMEYVFEYCYCLYID